MGPLSETLRSKYFFFRMTDVVWRGRSRDNTRHHSHTPPQRAPGCAALFTCTPLAGEPERVKGNSEQCRRVSYLGGSCLY